MAKEALRMRFLRDLELDLGQELELELELCSRKEEGVDWEHAFVVSFLVVTGRLLRGSCASMQVFWEEVYCLMRLKALDQAVTLTCVSADISKSEIVALRAS